MSLSNSGGSLVAWYKGAVRRLLQDLEPSRVSPADAECSRLEALEKQITSEVPICFLGASGVGKSTLINALVGHTIVPHGGIGPLTAQALCVRFNRGPAFEVRYHGSQQVFRLAFALEKMHLAALRKSGQAVNESSEDLLKDEELGSSAAEAAQDDSDQDREKKNLELRKQALAMVTGEQDGDRELPYLVDRLREMIGKRGMFGSQCFQEDRSRVERLKACLFDNKADRPIRFLNTDPNFKRELQDHAAGFLAPIIKELIVFWDAPILQKNVVLVDLPGVGIANDVKARVTEEYVRERAKAVVLVVSVRGVTESDAQLLRNSGFLNRLLHSADDPSADPVHLVLAVVRGDDIAESRYSDDRTRKKREHFADVCAQAKRETKKQLEDQLRQVWKTDETLSQTKEEVLQRIMDGLQVFPISAVQYRKAIENDPDDRAFIGSPEESKIPGLGKSLEELAVNIDVDRKRRLAVTRDVFFSNLSTSLRLIREQWTREDRAEAESEQLRQELEGFLIPIRKEFNTRRGEFRAFLRETIPSEVEKLVLVASTSAERAIRRYLNDLSDAHWATLKASVKRGGTFDGARHIDLPNHFALRFEEPIAEAWGKKLLQLIRGRTKQYTEDCVVLIEQVLTWAQTKGARIKTTLLEAQRDQVKSDAQQLTIIGKELVDEMREAVKNRLLALIRTPIRRRCKSFVDRNAHVGPGVKLRVLNLFDELAEDVVNAASPPAKELLTQRCTEVEKEISQILRAEHDPISEAANAVVESHEAAVRRSDARKRNAVLQQLDDAEASRPVLEPVEEAG